VGKTDEDLYYKYDWPKYFWVHKMSQEYHKAKEDSNKDEMAEVKSWQNFVSFVESWSHYWLKILLWDVFNCFCNDSKEKYTEKRKDSYAYSQRDLVF